MRSTSRQFYAIANPPNETLFNCRIAKIFNYFFSRLSVDSRT